MLLDSDPAGIEAKRKIDELALKEVANTENHEFRVLMLRDAASLKKTGAAIEDLFPNDFYRECVNEAYGVLIRDEDLPDDGSDMISARVAQVLRARHGRELEKKRVLGELLKRFDSWTSTKDLPKGTEKNAANLFKKINKAFGNIDPSASQIAK